MSNVNRKYPKRGSNLSFRKSMYANNLQPQLLEIKKIRLLMIETLFLGFQLKRPISLSETEPEVNRKIFASKLRYCAANIER